MGMEGGHHGGWGLEQVDVVNRRVDRLVDRPPAQLPLKAAGGFGPPP